MIDAAQLSDHARQCEKQRAFEIRRREFQADPRNGYPRVVKRMESNR